MSSLHLCRILILGSFFSSLHNQTISLVNDVLISYCLAFNLTDDTMQTKTTQNGPGKPTVLVLEDNADQWFMIRWENRYVA